MAVKTCPKCSEDNLSTAVVCISCGTSLSKCETVAGDENIELLHTKAREKGNPIKKWLIALVLLALLAAFALLIIKFAVR